MNWLIGLNQLIIYNQSKYKWKENAWMQLIIRVLYKDVTWRLNGMWSNQDSRIYLALYLMRKIGGTKTIHSKIYNLNTFGIFLWLGIIWHKWLLKLRIIWAELFLLFKNFLTNNLITNLDYFRGSKTIHILAKIQQFKEALYV